MERVEGKIQTIEKSNLKRKILDRIRLKERGGSPADQLYFHLPTQAKNITQ